MAILDYFRPKPVAQEPAITDSNGNGVNPRGVDLQQLIDSKSIDVVDINDSSIVVVEAPTHAMHQKHADPDALDLQMKVELGRTTTAYSRYLREEYNPELRDQQGLIKYDRMRRSDASVRSALKTLKTPILGATWYLQPFDDKKTNKDIATFVERNFTQYMSYPWPQVVLESLLMLDYGFWIFEKVWDQRKIGRAERIYLRKLAPRHPLDVVDWVNDANGGPAAVDMYNSPGSADHVRIPIDKLAIFSHDSEGGDLRGISVLRSAYKHWYFKENLYKIDAIQKERHGIGVPIIKLPPGFNTDDRDKAQELGENLRSNEKAHIVLPPYWEIMFAKLEGQPVSAIESAEHHNKMIYHNVLAQAVYASVTGSDTDVMELFYKSSRHLADMVRSVFNKFVIPQIVQPNWGTEDYPELKVRRLGDTKEARTISFALRNAVGAGIIRVDDDLEEWFRDLLDAPKHDPSTRRIVPAKQSPGGGGVGLGGSAQPTSARVGLPRQSPAAGGMQQGRSAGRSNSGFDKSGG